MKPFLLLLALASTALADPFADRHINDRLERLERQCLQYADDACYCSRRSRQTDAEYLYFSTQDAREDPVARRHARDVIKRRLAQ